jgi:DNA-binding transcriptional ArsR family regulator
MVSKTKVARRSSMAREEMEIRAGEVAGLLKTLAHPARLTLACTLAEGEHSVGALEQMLGINQPTLSQQLGVLREAGIVETRREAKQIFYRLTEAKTAQLIEALYSIFCVVEARR